MSAPDLTPHTAPSIGRRRAIWALVVIFLANFLNYLDRTLVSALELQLRPAFGLTEKEFGGLWSLFTIGYMVCAVPIGLLADRYRRTWLFAGCIVIWSVATVATGLTRDWRILYPARVLIGIGEAGCLVIGPALVADYFEQRKRGRALSIFYLGLPLGSVAAFIIPSLVLPEQSAANYEAEGQRVWPYLFYLAGYPGFLIALLIWLLRDPPRGAVENAGHGHAHRGGGGFREYLGLLKNKTLLLIIFAQAFAVFTIIPLIHFGKGFFINQRGLSEYDAGITLGLTVLVAGFFGSVLSGWIGDRLARRYRGAYALLAGIGYLVGWPCLMVGFMVADRWVFIPALGLGCFFYFFCMPAVNTQIANVVSPARRATAWALAVFILHLLGDTLSPWIFGGVSSEIGRENAFAYFSIGVALAGFTCLMAARTAAYDVGRVQAELEAEEAADQQTAAARQKALD